MALNKRHLHHIWRTLRKVHPWYFFAATLIFGVVSIVSLRANNEHMIRLRDDVYVADKSNGNVEAALRNLRSYVYGHMNTSLASGPSAVHPPIQLKYTYDRLKTAATQQAGSTNASLYNDAQKYCEQQDSTDVYGYYRLGCVGQYVTSHGATYTAPAAIPDSLYKFDFTSAKWSPDAAGLSIVAAIFSIILLVVTSVYRWWAKKYL